MMVLYIFRIDLRNHKRHFRIHSECRRVIDNERPCLDRSGREVILAAGGLIRQFTLGEIVRMVLIQTTFIILLGIIVEAILKPVLPISVSEY